VNAKPAGNKKATKALDSSSNKGMLYTVLALVAVAVVVLGGVIWLNRDGGQATPVTFGETSDANIELTDTGVIAVGDPSAPTVQIWEDFMCPACAQFEGQFGGQIASAVQEGEVRTEFHILNFQNRASGSGEYSTRAIAAMQCVAAGESVETFFSVKNSYFAQQPTGGGDLSPDELADAAEAAGASEDTAACIREVENGDAMDKAEDTAKNAQRTAQDVIGRVSTPSVAHDGTEVDWNNPTWLDEIISAA